LAIWQQAHKITWILSHRTR